MREISFVMIPITRFCGFYLFSVLILLFSDVKVFFKHFLSWRFYTVHLVIKLLFYYFLEFNLISKMLNGFVLEIEVLFQVECCFP